MLFLLFAICGAVTWLPNIIADVGQSHTITKIYQGHYYTVDSHLYFQVQYSISTTLAARSTNWNDILTLPFNINGGNNYIIGTANALMSATESLYEGGSISYVGPNTVRITTRFASFGLGAVMIFAFGSCQI